MKDIVCYDIAGNYLDHFTQWDKGRYVKLVGIESGDVEIYVGNRIGDSLLVTDAQINGDSVMFKIPDSILQIPEPVLICVRVVTEQQIITTNVARIPVYPVPKPQSYKYCETPVLKSTGSLTATDKYATQVACGFSPDLVVLSGLFRGGEPQNLAVSFQETGKTEEVAIGRDVFYPIVLGTVSKQENGFEVIIDAFDTNGKTISDAEIILNYKAVKYTA